MTDSPRSMPTTSRGVTAPYQVEPWTLTGRALAIWFKPQDPREARRHVPAVFDTDDDAILGARIWELHHDAGDGRADTIGEATIAFPVGFRTARGDNTVHIYADDPTWMLFGREVMGWPTLPGDIALSPAPGEPGPGDVLTGGLRRFGRPVLDASITLIDRVDQADLPDTPPVWLTEKVIPSVAGGPPSLHQIVRTGPSSVRWGEVWNAAGELTFHPTAHDEIHHLGPLEVVRAQYWSHLTLILAPGEILADLVPR